MIESSSVPTVDEQMEILVNKCVASAARKAAFGNPRVAKACERLAAYCDKEAAQIMVRLSR